MSSPSFFNSAQTGESVFTSTGPSTLMMIFSVLLMFDSFLMGGSAKWSSTKTEAA